MIKILFVCHGNICRSPMAEFVMKDMVAKAGLSGQVQVNSVAASREEEGNFLYPPARRELEKHGVPFERKRARLITWQDVEEYDRIYYMDASNARYLNRMLKETSKCFPLLEHDVADPWSTGDFSETWDDILEGCTRILEELA